MLFRRISFSWVGVQLPRKVASITKEACSQSHPFYKRISNQLTKTKRNSTIFPSQRGAWKSIKMEASNTISAERRDLVWPGQTNKNLKKEGDNYSSSNMCKRQLITNRRITKWLRVRLPARKWGTTTCLTCELCIQRFLRGSAGATQAI
jgi:hypothetical protein